jgi:hypothetical protein
MSQLGAGMGFMPLRKRYRINKKGAAEAAP